MKLLTTLMLIGALLTPVVNAEWTFTLSQELSVSHHSLEEDNKLESRLQKFETRLSPELNLTLNDNLDMTFITRFRADAFNHLGLAAKGLPQEMKNYHSDINGPLIDNNNADFDVREWYFDAQVNEQYWRIGKQQVVWGQADGLKILDVINPQEYREFILADFEESRIPLWMINVEIPVGIDDTLQVLWIPDLTFNRMASFDSAYQFSSPLLVPYLPAGFQINGVTHKRPNTSLENSEIGLRYAKFYQGWDLTFNYFYHFQDNPALYQNVNEHQVLIEAEYERNHLMGLTASKAFDDLTIRLELGYSSDTYHLLSSEHQVFSEQKGIHHSVDVSSVFGLDWQGLENTMVSVQWFQSYLMDEHEGLIRPRQNHVLSLLYKQTFQNEVYELEVLGLHGLDKNDSSLQVKLSYLLENEIKVWLGTDLFFGNQQGLFGQFDGTDRFNFGVEWSF